MRASLASLLALLLSACGGDGEAASPAAAPQAAQAEPAKVGYDLRRLRPTTDEPLEKTFARMHAQAKAEGKQVAMLFSAEWCERCRRLELELGNLHPATDIGHVRILELVEEDWEQALRMNEFDLLRQRWDATRGTYPLFVVLDAEGRKVEEMKEAVDRLEQAGREATVATWFRGLRSS
jgi:thiol-disulfide isomerase/thioredoxin